METCVGCGGTIQYDEGLLTQTGFNLEGVSEQRRCERCAGPVLAEAMLKAASAEGSSSSLKSGILCSSVVFCSGLTARPRTDTFSSVSPKATARLGSFRQIEGRRELPGDPKRSEESESDGSAYADPHPAATPRIGWGVLDVPISSNGHYDYGAVRLRWEVSRHPDAPEGAVGRCLRSFLALLHRTLEKFPVGRRARAERALRDLVGTDAPHAEMCDCREPGDPCPWCRARLTLKAAR